MNFAKSGAGPCAVAPFAPPSGRPWFEEHTDEFHLMSWPPNSPDLNPMEHMWDVMERQLRAQTPPCPNISTLRDLFLDIWYNLSPVMYQKLVATMPRRVAAVLKPKGGALNKWS
ncbi:hypothetical protein AVEN_209179-1 [Araneus ventricosus]|uniref:Tc1-like transposase DDE domain-containing protein n=1 Tax=Araneus ventricosus TaxID=182803 RepID=A0A4Y2NUU6_ARAVE|nr:hypothetical protein AVEN_209179-1 [Araneus ventricosus]